MSTAINVPKLGVSMTEATLVEWVAVDGSAVAIDDVICRIETDKVELDIPAPWSGTLVHKATVGELYQVGDLIAEIG